MMLFRFIFIATVIFVSNAASAKRFNCDWLPYTPTPPIVGGKFVRLEKKVRKPITIES